MGLPITSIVRNARSNWTFSWTSTGAAYYRIVLYGQLLATVTGTSYTPTGTSVSQSFSDFPPPIEVEPETTPALSELYYPCMLIQWYGIATAGYYEVQSYDGADWNTVAQITEAGDWIYSWQGSVLADETTYQYRVIAVDGLGQTSAPRGYTESIVRPPDPPDKTTVIVYTGPGTHQAQVSPVP